MNINAIILKIKKNLGIKYSTFKVLCKDPKLRQLLLIDLIFYIYSIFGYIAAINIGIYFSLTFVEVSLAWSIIFIPIIVLKITKEINKDIIIGDKK